MAFPLDRMANSDEFLARLDAAEQARFKLKDTGPPVYSEGLPSVVPGSSMEQTAAAGKFAQAANDPKNFGYFTDFLQRLRGGNFGGRDDDNLA